MIEDPTFEEDERYRRTVEQIFDFGTTSAMIPNLTEKERGDFRRAATEAFLAALPAEKEKVTAILVSPVFLSQMRAFIQEQRSGQVRTAMMHALSFYIDVATRHVQSREQAVSPNVSRRSVIVGGALAAGVLASAEIWHRISELEKHHPFARHIAKRIIERPTRAPKMDISPKAQILIQEWEVGGLLDIKIIDPYTWEVRVFPAGGSTRSVTIPVSRGAREVLFRTPSKEKALLIHIRPALDTKTLEEGPPVTIVLKEVKAEASIIGLDVSVQPYESEERYERTLPPPSLDFVPRKQ